MTVKPPTVVINVLDGGLGNSAASPSNVVAVFGPSSAGPTNAPQVFAGQPADVVVASGYGPGPSLVAALVASGVTTVFTRVPTDEAGAAGSVTHTGTGLSAMTVTGTPLDQYDVIVTVQQDGVAGATPGPTVTVSFDGNQSISRAIRVPAGRSVATFAAQTGMTLVFSAAAMVAGDQYFLSTTPPTTAAADVAAAVDSLRQSRIQAALGYCVGPVDAAGATTISGSVGLYQAAHRYVRFMLESVDIADDQTVDQWMAALEADFAGFEDVRVAVAGGWELVLDPVTRFSLRRSVGWNSIVRLGTTPVSQDPSMTAAGPLVPFSGAAATSQVFYDEYLNEGLGEQGRFFTLTSYQGAPGYYVACPCLMSDPTSDFDMVQLGRLMDESCRVADVYFTGLLGSPVRRNPKTGNIIARDVMKIVSGSDEAQSNALIATGNASSVETTVSPVLTNNTLQVTITIQPNGDIREVDVTLTFVNFQPAAAA